MSNDKTINLKVNVETNDSAIENAKRRLREIETAQRDLSASILKSGGSNKEAESKIKSLNEEYQALNKTLKATGNAYETLAKETSRMDANSGIEGAKSRLDKVSSDVGLSGDIESSGRAIGGTLGAFGATGAERAIGQGAEIFALGKAIPRLKEGLTGLPVLFSAITTSLGPIGIALVALSAVAAAVAFAISKSSEELGKATTAKFENQRSIDQGIASGSLDTTSAQARLAELQILVERETELKLEAEREYQSASFNILDQGLNQQEEALATQATTSTELLKDYQSEITALNRNISDGTIPETKEAAETTKALASAVKTLGSSASQAKQQVSSSGGRGSNESRNEFLNRQVSEKYATRRAEQARQGQEQIAKRQARSQALKDAHRANNEERVAKRDDAKKALDEQAELSNNFQKNEVKSAIEQYRTLERIREDALISEQEAIREGSIFAVRDIREKASRDLKRSGEDFENSRKDRLVDFREQFAELLQSINPSAAQGQFSAINQFQQGRANGNITINANGLNLPQARTLVQTELARTYR